MKATFDQRSAERYEFTHGHRPKGSGFWSFQLHRSGASTEFCAHGKYSDAKREAMREARSLGCEEVTVNT